MLGFSNIEGIDAVSGHLRGIEGLNSSNNWNLDSHGNKLFASSPADWTMPYDPGHEFDDVREQLCGAGGNYPYINNSGFVTRYSKIDPANPGEIMKCYAPDQLPVLTALAREFAVCDHWFASMPGPTWPNRFFVHAASSAGLDHSPQPLNMAESILFKGFTFENGTIYDRLDRANLGWTIYKGVIDSTTYDHASALATVEGIFGLLPLTERDKHANTLNHLFSLATPRTDVPTTLPAPANSGIRCEGDPGASVGRMLSVSDVATATEPVPSSLQGFLHVAFLRDLQASPPEEQASRTARFLNIKTRLEAKRYMDEVRQKVEP